MAAVSSFYIFIHCTATATTLTHIWTLVTPILKSLSNKDFFFFWRCISESILRLGKEVWVGSQLLTKYIFIDIYWALTNLVHLLYIKRTQLCLCGPTFLFWSLFPLKLSLFPRIIFTPGLVQVNIQFRSCFSPCLRQFLARILLKN